MLKKLKKDIFRKCAGIPDFLTADDMIGRILFLHVLHFKLFKILGMVQDNRIDPKMVFSYVQEVYRMCNDL